MRTSLLESLSNKFQRRRQNIVDYCLRTSILSWKESSPDFESIFISYLRFIIIFNIEIKLALLNHTFSFVCTCWNALFFFGKGTLKNPSSTLFQTFLFSSFLLIPINASKLIINIMSNLQLYISILTLNRY